MDSIHFLLWHLLQAVRNNGEKITVDLILDSGILVFALLVVGLFLTYKEFSKFE
jgi:hypothetical protein